ncbi:MAG: hypothetical protein Q9227_005994 [Pyrenula ochraceoflavens]
MAEPLTIPSVKDLASSDPSIRRAAFNKISSHLRTRQTLTSTEALQLWRGFFFLLWMHDPRVPSSTPKLITELSSLISAIPRSAGAVFCAGFWETMAREWGGIDRGRLDKYLSLVRAALREEFGVVRRGDDSELEEHVNVLAEWPMCADQRKVPDGLRYQVLDCWSDELLSAGLIEDGEANEGLKKLDEGNVDKARKLMQLVFSLQRETPSKGIKMRAKDVWNEERLAPYLPER